MWELIAMMQFNDSLAPLKVEPVWSFHLWSYKKEEIHINWCKLAADSSLPPELWWHLRYKYLETKIPKSESQLLLGSRQLNKRPGSCSWTAGLAFSNIYHLVLRSSIGMMNLGIHVTITAIEMWLGNSGKLMFYEYSSTFPMHFDCRIPDQVVPLRRFMTSFPATRKYAVCLRSAIMN